MKQNQQYDLSLDELPWNDTYEYPCYTLFLCRLIYSLIKKTSCYYHISHIFRQHKSIETLI